jgi:hypothetical protein
VYTRWNYQIRPRGSRNCWTRVRMWCADERRKSSKFTRVICKKKKKSICTNELYGARRMRIMSADVRFFIFLIWFHRRPTRKNKKFLKPPVHLSQPVKV